MKSSYTSLTLTLLISSTLLSQSILSVSAAVPTGVPSGSSAPAGGYFSQYFQNIIQNAPCNPGSVITGFDTNSGINYGVRTCTPIKSLLATIYGSSPAPANTVFDGYLSNGDIRWSPATWLKSGTAVYYNGGNVGIGTSSPTAKLQVAGTTKVDKIQLWDKVVLSWIWDAHANDGWIRMMSATNPSSYGGYGLAADKLYAATMEVGNSPTAANHVANKAYVDARVASVWWSVASYHHLPTGSVAWYCAISGSIATVIAPATGWWFWVCGCQAGWSKHQMGTAWPWILSMPTFICIKN